MARNGRPRKEIDWKEFEQLCFLQCSIAEMCQWLHVTDKTLQRRVKEQYGETFSSVFEKKRVGGLISLRRNMFKMSEKNPAVAIFLAKNLLGMSDKQEITGAEGEPIQVAIDAKGKLIGILNRFSSRAGEAEGDTKPESEGG